MCRAQFARHVRMSAELLAIGSVLDEAGIPWVAIKGPILTDTLYARSDSRGYVDLDLLVPPRQMGAAIGALTTAGCSLMERNWPAVRALSPGELHLMTQARTLIDLHWHVINERDARRDSAAHAEVLVSRGRMIRLQGGSVPTLDPIDTVVHLCIHAALAGGSRLALLVDIDRALATTPLEGVVSRALELNAGPAVEVMLRRVRSVIGTEVDSVYLKRLVPSRRWRLVSASSAMLPPVHRARGRGSVSRLVARAARGDAAASLREAARRVWHWCNEGSTASSGVRRRDWDAGNPESLMYDVGEPDGLAAYLADIEEESQMLASRSRSISAPSSALR